MSTITAKDGTQIYYKDWGQGPVITFSHGWPLSSDAWDGQMLFLAQQGFRVVAHDRRGHGRSSQASSGNDMDGYADDLAAVIEALDLKDATLVGHSTGGGEVARYIGRHGTKRVKKAVLIAAVPPIMLQTPANPEGLPMKVFDEIRAGVAGDRSQYYKDLAIAFMAQTGLARRSRKAFLISSGCGACRPGSRTPTRASKHSPKPTLPRTSKRSMCQRSLCTAKMTRSSRSTTLRESRPGSSGTQRKSTIQARHTASRPRTTIRSMPICWPSSGASLRQGLIGKGPR